MNMALLQEWRDYAYKFDDRTAEGQQFWLNYFNIEKGIYEQLLADKDTVVSGTVKELADKYETELQMFVGFLDGINDSLKEANPIEEMDENTQVSLDIDFEKLYYNMVGCRAEWLYNLKEWDDILTEERRKELYKESRNSTTVVKGKIHPHAEAVKNTKNAAEKTLNSLKEIVEYVNETRKNLLAYVIAEGFFYFRKF